MQIQQILAYNLKYKIVVHLKYLNNLWKLFFTQLLSCEYDLGQNYLKILKVNNIFVCFTLSVDVLHIERVFCYINFYTSTLFLMTIAQNLLF